MCATALKVPLCIIFNKSIGEGVFPDLWKIAKVTPINKSGDKKDVTNYRPICILNCFAKLFESMVYYPLYNHFKHRLSPNQHGFIRGRSTLTNLLTYTNDLCQALNKRSQVDAIYTDFAKAFDRVNHDILLIKLQHLGVHGNLHRWLRTYLMSRTQLVALYGFESIPFEPSSGIPQGSNLGPLLFLVFINDLLEKITCPCLAYADDLKLYKEISNINDSIHLQDNINILNEWCIINYMTLNIKKCQYITITKKSNIINYNYSIEGIILDKVNTVRDLGVWFDSSLNFKYHYKTIVAKANRMLGFIMRTAKPFREINSLKILYISLVRSHLEYCSSVWSPIYKIDATSIESIQKRFLRQLSIKLGLRRTIPDYEDRLVHFQFQSLIHRRKITDFCILHKIVNGIFSEELLANVKIVIRKFATRKPMSLFYIPSSNNNVGRNNPLQRMCQSYNETCIDICPELDIFHQNLYNFKKSLLKLDLLNTD